ncbi:MAG: hypothetical protein ACJ762_05235 [Solirubrobacteraceae bacterium]
MPPPSPVTPGAVDQLAQRLDRLEAEDTRFRHDVRAQLRRADIALEDIVAALEVLRSRIEALEPPERSPAP